MPILYGLCDEFSGGADLAELPAVFSANYSSLLSQLGSTYNFSYDGGSNSISDGGGDMYDGGNYLNTNYSSNFSYTGGSVVSGGQFGPAGAYFTQQNPGMFMLAADLDNVSFFEITGNLGADGGGSTTGYTLTSGDYTGYYRRVCSAGDPSVNQLFIVESSAGASQTWSTNTDNNQHRVQNLTSATRLYYILWAGQSGLCYSETAVQNLFNSFMAILPQGNPALIAGQESNTEFPAGTTTVTWEFEGSDGNTYDCSFDVTVLIPGWGCTDPQACNYDPTAEFDDNSCITGGCLDENACNFDPAAPCDNGSCAFVLDCAGNCGGVFIEDDCGNCFDPNGEVSASFEYSGNVQQWIVPEGVTEITIEAFGAQGGGGSSNSLVGGLGARMSGTFAVTPGQVLDILVGEQGRTGGATSDPHGNENGGGGGSFVVLDADNTPLLIAGGGGGGPSTIYGTACSRDVNMAHGQITENGSGTNCYSSANGGSNGNGGSTAGNGYQGGAGGGFNSDGQNGWAHCGTPQGGRSYLNGGAGGTSSSCYSSNGARGGFGGGGAGELGSPGGGGGYSGGAASGNWSSYSSYGGGGGSFNSGTEQDNQSGFQSGNGLVIITYSTVPFCNPGCTDPTADNYDPTANFEDGSCSFVLGCTDTNACNFDPTALEEDGSCLYLDCAGNCGGNFVEDACGNCYDPNQLGEITFNYTGNYQTWTVPEDGTYIIEAAGGQGGSVNMSNQGGLGASMRGEFFLTAGTQLQILVGQQGMPPSNPSNEGGGGGGGSFVATGSNYSSATPLIVAGGGGGGTASYQNVNQPGQGGQTTNNGTGGGDSGSYCDSGGAGFNGNSTCSGNARSFVNGGNGGVSNYSGNGGFGGGGASIHHPGGGGGGYTGGRGGDNFSTTARGGGSFNSGENQVNTASANDGQGYVIIQYNSIPSCVEGCIDPTACNYDETADVDNGTCFYPDGCTDAAACNYDAAALCDNGSCTYPGCIDGTACNFDPSASCDNGSCVYIFDCAGNCGGAFIEDDCGNCYDPTAVNGSGSMQFDFTGGEQVFVVPDGVTQLTFECFGAEGQGSDISSFNAGRGGYATGQISVTPGETLYIYVGGQSGYNGGGTGASNRNGGGASDIRLGGNTLQNRIIVAAGGGGAGAQGPGGDGGAGQTCPEGAAGLGGVCSGCSWYAGSGGDGSCGAGGNGGSSSSGYASGGGGAGLTSGGAGSSSGGYGSSGTSGTLGQGGNRGSSNCGCSSGAGGGGGYYGGGGSADGCCAPGGGGGGSSYIGGVINGSTQGGVQSSNGLVMIQWELDLTPVCNPGCTDPTADNYDAEANFENGSCSYDLGCMDTNACNYDPIALEEDGSCLYLDCAGNCGGSFIEDLCGNCYDPNDLASTTFSYTGSLQQWTVPEGITEIVIEAYGAQGGGGGSNSLVGGMGARMSGVFAVTPGQVLDILVGEQGRTGGATSDPHGNENGGGGGSFVVLDADNTPLLIAGGGGGGPATSYGLACTRDITMAHGQITETGGNVFCLYSVSGGNGGNGGNATGYMTGGAGGGFYGNGSNGGNHCCTSIGGQSYLSGAAGGSGNCCYGSNNRGGYGGGGGGQLGGPGGGGGYSGGSTAADWSSYSTYGGGGGSYNSGTNQNNQSGFQEGNGLVIISYSTAPECDPGCMDATACNYDENADVDDGSCFYPDGCTDAAACNFDPNAQCDNGTCTYPGCNDAAACNFDPAAACNDGSCIFVIDCAGNCGGAFVQDDCGNCYDPTIEGGTTFTYTGTIQQWIVPDDVTEITVEAFGAQGGGGGSNSLAGGLGARMSGTFAVTPGQVLDILVGEQGRTGGATSDPHGNENGGGGGSFVVLDADNTPLLIAGGGGGGPSTIYGTACSRDVNMAHGQVSENGNGTNCYSSANGGSNGNGGSTAGNGYQGGAGGGFNTDGQNGWAQCGTPQGGRSYLNGGAGGTSNSCYSGNGARGGFGGGGAGELGSPGGGGGYSGGAASGNWSSYSSYGGGGGSFNSGTNQDNQGGIQSGNGLVIITYSTTPYCNPGCTDPIADNFNPESNFDDGSCIYPGCTDSGACNYDAAANFDDGSCIFIIDCAGVCGGNSITDECGTCYDPTESGENYVFNYTGFMQSFVVPDGVSQIYVEAVGASGGAYDGSEGGLGASVSGVLSVTPGQQLKLLIGAQGEGGDGSVRSAGGGGGTFVTTNSNAPLFVAGGGGGVVGGPMNANRHASMSESGNNGYSPNSPTNYGVGGASGNGASNVSMGAACGGNGGGLLTNGEETACVGLNPVSGESFLNGASGGEAACGNNLSGGYGGGGGGGCLGAGGGGGYSGGGGSYGIGGNGGGGGSFNIDTEGVNLAQANNGNGYVVISILPTPLCTPGCTDPLADNYDPAANFDDGSCSTSGCTDPMASNYNASATNDNGSCLYPGCTYATAVNYDANANVDDGSCQFACSLAGCTDSTALNYSPNATEDDGSCVYDTNVYGCTYPAALNYNPAATADDGSCEYPHLILGCTYSNALNYNPTANFDDGSCTYSTVVPGCTDSTALNYAPSATEDDGSCTYDTNVYGCTYPGALNYDASATSDDGSCIYNTSIPGCTDQFALNYMPSATEDDGSCTYDTNVYGCTYPSATNYDAAATADDGSCIIECTTTSTGCTDSAAINYMPSATEDDGSCVYDTNVYGCLYSSALNFNPQATADNGTCLFPTDFDSCPADLNNDGLVNASDLSLFLSAFGTLCSGTVIPSDIYPYNCTPEFVFPAQGAFAAVTDVDGNVYRTMVIAGRELMAENLRVTHFANGDPIPMVSDAQMWSELSLTEGSAMSYANSDNSTMCPYGVLYNYYTVIDCRDVCPSGWHVPTSDEWDFMTTYLGGTEVAGGMLKSTNSDYWTQPNTDATNSSGYSALPSGSRSASGDYTGFGSEAYWWTATQVDAQNASSRGVQSSSGEVTVAPAPKTAGYSVRCFRDQ
jgi:uncharacterized protein (TIGR02145 family)